MSKVISAISHTLIGKLQSSEPMKKKHDKIQHPFMIKRKGTHKFISSTPTNITEVRSEKLFPQGQEPGEDLLLLPLPPTLAQIPVVSVGMYKKEVIDWLEGNSLLAHP